MAIGTRGLGLATALVVLASLSACGSGTSESSTSSASAAALVPEDVRASGVLTFGVEPLGAPNEFLDAQGNLAGWDIEIAQALSAKLNLKPEFIQTKFIEIIPGVVSGKYDLGVNSFFDTKERQTQVDMVDYYRAGIQWAALAGSSVDPDNACGLTVAVNTDTYEALVDLPAKSKACTDAGKPAISVINFATEAEAAAAVVSGRADAYSCDLPFTSYAVAQSNGKLQLAGDVYSIFFYGLPIPKGSPLSAPLKAALEEIIADGTYIAILKKWSVEAGAVSEITINGA
jgi:polar amino acid transport system substrate-binding protein